MVASRNLVEVYHKKTARARRENFWVWNHWACELDHLDSVKFLISKGSDFTSTNNHGHTPLHLSSTYRYTLIVDCITRRGAEAAGTCWSVDYQNATNYWPL